MSAYPAHYRTKPLIFLIAFFISVPLNLFGSGQYVFGADLAGGVAPAQNEATLTTPAPAIAVSAPSPARDQDAPEDFSTLSNVGNVERLDAAIKEGAVRIAVVGDSISQGDVDGRYENSVVATLMRLAREQNPDIAFTFGNFSLAGRGMGMYSNPGYKGEVGPVDNAVSGFYRQSGSEVTRQWPGGSVEGKSWVDHVKDFAPDLVIYMFGANDLTGSSSVNADYYFKALDYQNTWSKVPSTAIAPAALPSLAFGHQEQVQVAADAARDVAKVRHLTVLDINRLFNIHRAGVDVDKLSFIRDDNLASYPSGWSPETGTTFAVSGSPEQYALKGRGAAMFNRACQDVSLSATFTMPSWSGQIGAIRYRSMGSGLSQYTAQVTANQVLLYWGGTVIGRSAVYAAIPDGTSVSIKVTVRGARHEVYLNGVNVISVYDFNNLRFGKVGLVVSGAEGTISNWVANLGVPEAHGAPDLNDIEIYGLGDFGTNPGSVGGNTINHPTKLANAVIWGGALSPLLQHIRSQPRGGMPASTQASH